MSKANVLALAVVVLASLSCAKVPMTAPAGASIFLIANPTFVVANGGRSVVSALLTEPAGTLVPDGTVVLFFTDLGHIDPQGKTKDGVARVNFVSDSRSGVATITAISGGAAAPAPAPSGSPSPTTTTSTSGNGTASIQIGIGSSLPKTVLVSADPQRITRSASSFITANVFDQSGNPVANVPVLFSLDPAGLETLDSGGVPQFTDTSGRAFDVLRTSAATGTSQFDLFVIATTPTGAKGQVTVFVD